MRKRKLSIYDIGRLPSTPVENESGFQTKKEFLEQEERDRIAAEQSAERRRTAPLREAEMELREAAREASARLKAYWSQPLTEIQTNGLSLTPTDIAGDYEIGPRDTEKENTAWKEFLENVKSCGCTLSDTGIMRLSWYLSALAFRRGVSLTSIENFAKALERLHSLQVFPAGELENYQPTPTKTVEQPQRHRCIDPLAEIESLNLDSREGNRRAKEISNQDFFGREMAHVVDQFEGWLLATFNYVLTPEARQAAGKWWMNNPTENPLRGESWTRLRLNLVKKHFMPESCLTKEELLDREIEASSDRSDSYETRRMLRQAVRDLAQK